jgi:hypothetical protein
MMNIGTILGPLMSSAKAITSGLTPDVAAVPPPGPAIPSARATASFEEIVGKCNVRDMSPREFSELSQQLFEAGLISQSELKELAAIRLELDESGVDADEPLDLVDFFQDKLQVRERQLASGLKNEEDDPSGAEQQWLQATQQQLDWLEKFAALRRGPSMKALDAII